MDCRIFATLELPSLTRLPGKGRKADWVYLFGVAGHHAVFACWRRHVLRHNEIIQRTATPPAGGNTTCWAVSSMWSVAAMPTGR